ncbi:thiol:disulfide interchange protein TlpA [Terrarubrum flagellatum]|uniref:thiol:disulfide interchange protein TlpA n=1 Tax=Terrirubrum flagellatum TaxID=2895980 RepID=UPI0031450079
MTEPASSLSPAPRRFRRSLIALAALVVAAGAAGGLLYGSFAGGNETACAASKTVAQKVAPLAKGEVAALVVRDNPGALPNLDFVRPDGQAMKLSDFKGKTVLLNLWATWCAPCRKEMPALDRLQESFGGEDFQVVSINIDQRGEDKPHKFLNEIGVTRLVRYADASAKVFSDLKGAGKAFGMPTTILIDRNGCEIGNLAGPAEWSSPDAFALIRAALAG